MISARRERNLAACANTETDSFCYEAYTQQLQQEQDLHEMPEDVRRTKHEQRLPGQCSLAATSFATSFDTEPDRDILRIESTSTRDPTAPTAT